MKSLIYTLLAPVVFLSLLFTASSQEQSPALPPIIRVTPTIDFGVILETVIKTEMIGISNRGDDELLITGYKAEGSFGQQFKPQDWPAISASNPLRISSGQAVQLAVRFSSPTIGQFKGVVKFLSNSVIGSDSSCTVSGTVALPQLVVTHFDWGRKRIESRRTPKTPYPGTITIENLATKAVTVVKAIANANSAFGYNVSDFAGLVFQPGDKKTFNIVFNPNVVGPHQLNIAFETNDPLMLPMSELRGIGVVPRIKAKDVDFGWTELHGGSSVRDIEIECVSYQWEDALTITDFFPATPGTVGTVGKNAYGTKGFGFDLATLIPNGKLLLQPGEKTVVSARFRAPALGTFSEPMITKSDAETEDTSIWTGTGAPIGVEETTTTDFNIKLHESAPDATAITLQLASPERVRFIIYDAVGRAVATSDDAYDAGETTVRFATVELPAGIYRVLAATPRRTVSLPVAVVR